MSVSQTTSASPTAAKVVQVRHTKLVSLRRNFFGNAHHNSVSGEIFQQRCLPFAFFPTALFTFLLPRDIKAGRIFGNAPRLE
jgi:hypothetical protein